MVLLLVQAILTSATVVHCASYKSQLRMGAPECDDNMHTATHYCEVRQVKAGVVDTNVDKSVCLFLPLSVPPLTFENMEMMHWILFHV